jgi:hypothetical protein
MEEVEVAMESDFREVHWGCVLKDDLVRPLSAEEQRQADHPNCDHTFGKRAILRSVFDPLPGEPYVTILVTDPIRSAPITGDIAAIDRTEQLAIYDLLKRRVGVLVDAIVDEVRVLREVRQ